MRQSTAPSSTKSKRLTLEDPLLGAHFGPILHPVEGKVDRGDRVLLGGQLHDPCVVVIVFRSRGQILGGFDIGEGLCCSIVAIGVVLILKLLRLLRLLLLLLLRQPVAGAAHG